MPNILNRIDWLSFFLGLIAMYVFRYLTGLAAR